MVENLGTVVVAVVVGFFLVIEFSGVVSLFASTTAAGAVGPLLVTGVGLLALVTICTILLGGTVSGGRGHWNYRLRGR